MRIDGRCHCGYITYEADIDPAKTLICHCTDCQTLSGAAFRVVAYTREDAFRLLSGALKIYVKTSESGINGHNRSARNVERRFMRRRLGQDRRFIPFGWAQFVSAISLSQMCKYGLALRRHGSVTLKPCQRSRSSRRSTLQAT